jgi:hypothetical protein
MPWKPRACSGPNVYRNSNREIEEIFSIVIFISVFKGTLLFFTYLTARLNPFLFLAPGCLRPLRCQSSLFSFSSVFSPWSNIPMYWYTSTVTLDLRFFSKVLYYSPNPNSYLTNFYFQSFFTP